MSCIPYRRGRYRCLLLGIAALVVAAAYPGEGWAYRHHNSNIAYHEYNQATFDLARRENKPVFMVLSAVWCFWCKAYEQRALEKAEVSAYLNRNFINIFVDLDQRQDLQHLYVKKGIPTTVIFTPEGVRFLTFSGTLNEREFLTGMRQVLADMRSRTLPPERESAPSVHDVRELLAEPRGGRSARASWRELSARHHAELVALALESFDAELGGFGQGKKYPLGLLAQYLLEARAGRGTQGRDARRAALGLLDSVARHLYDPVEGGFYRYADGRNWRSPHHEKMLVTNVNLLRAYLLAAGEAKKTGGARHADYGAIYGRSLSFLLGTFVQEQGGLAGSLDGKDPKYYRLSAAKRAGARRPALDRTVYTAWNGEAAYVLSEIYRTHPSPRLLRTITALLDFLQARLMSPGTGLYSFLRPTDAEAAGLGQLKDNSWGALAFITGYQLTGRAEYLRSFERILAYVRGHLFVPEVKAYRLWNVPSKSGFRAAEHMSQEVPLGANGVLAYSLVKAYIVTKFTKYLNEAEGLVGMLSRLDIREFEDDPGDDGKQFLLSYVYYLKALQQLADLGS